MAGSTRRLSSKASTPIGTLIRKQLRQPSSATLASISSPPINWPPAAASPSVRPYAANARWRCAPANKVPSIASTCGCSSAPAMPCANARRNQHLRVRRQPAGSRREREQADADHEEAAAAVDVAEPPAGDQRGGVCEAIADHDQLQRAAACVQLMLDRRDRDVDDEEVEHHHERAAQHDEKRDRARADPRPPRRAGVELTVAVRGAV
jgi:hypothetical protein